MDVLMKRIFVLSSCLIGCLGLRAQDKKFENLSIDRPDVSNLPITVRPGHFQFELGTEWGKSTHMRESSLPNLIFRTGLTNKSELRVGFTNYASDSIMKNWRDRVLIPTLSIKYRFVEEKGVRPAIAIQPEIVLPFGQGTDVSQAEANFTLMNYSLLLLFNNTLHEKVFFNYNAGVLWNREGKADLLLSASTSFAHTHRLGYFFEGYSIFNDAGFPLSFDGGVTFLVHPRFQLDVYGGNREADGSRYWFYGGGIGFRIDPDDIKPESFKKTGIHH
jgi:Putative MetA-pathway of phenol degradation